MIASLDDPWYSALVSVAWLGKNPHLPAKDHTHVGEIRDHLACLAMRSVDLERRAFGKRCSKLVVVAHEVIVAKSDPAFSRLRQDEFRGPRTAAGLRSRRDSNQVSHKIPRRAGGEGAALATTYHFGKEKKRVRVVAG